MTPIRHVLAGLLLAATPIAAGCGAAPEPITCPEPPAMPTEPAPNNPIGGPAAPGMPGGQADPARDMVARSQAAFTAFKGYELEMKYFQKQGSKTSTGTYEIRGKQPRAMRIFIKEGGSKGTTVRWDGGSTCQVRPGGLLGAITVTLSLDDERLKGVRGYTLDMTDLPSMYGFMLDPANQATFLGQGPQGVAVAVSGPKLLKGCQRMVTSFDPTTLMPKKVEFMDSREVVFRMTLSNMKPRPNVSLEI